MEDALVFEGVPIPADARFLEDDGKLGAVWSDPDTGRDVVVFSRGKGRPFGLLTAKEVTSLAVFRPDSTWDTVSRDAAAKLAAAPG